MHAAQAGARPATITTDDGFAIAAQCRAGVLLVGAIGVVQRYYGAFARRLKKVGDLPAGVMQFVH